MSRSFFFIKRERERTLSHERYRVLSKEGFVMDRMAYYNGYHAHLMLFNNESLILDVSSNKDSIYSLIKLLGEGPSVGEKGSNAQEKD